MKNHRKHEMRLQDLVRIVSQYSRNDHEAGPAVADLINRGRVKLHGRFNNYKVVVS
jgi:hypothetical protein